MEEGRAQYESKPFEASLESLNNDYAGYQEESRASIRSPYASLSIKKPKEKRQGAVTTRSFSIISDLFCGFKCIGNLSTIQKVLITIILILIIIATFIVEFSVKVTDENSESAEIRVDACAVNKELCVNGGMCNSTQTSYTCTCAEGFTGHNCEYSTCAASKISSLNLEVVSLDCGGIIPIPQFPSHNSLLLDYKGNVTYKNKEQCLWTLNNTVAGMNYPVFVKINLLCEGFANSSGALSVLPWNHVSGDYILPYKELTPQNPNYVSSSGDWDYKVFLNYASSGDKFGTGFLILVTILRTIQSGLGSNFFFNASPGSQVYGTLRKNDHFSIVVNPSENTTVFTVDYLDSGHTGRHIWIDKLDIYEIPPRSKPIRLARLSESFTTPRSFPFKHAMLATFQAWDTITGNGFKFSWK